MFNNITLKTLRDQRKSLVWWSLGMVMLLLITVLFYPSFLAAGSGVDEMFESMPEPLRVIFVGEVSELTSPEGYLNSQIFVLLIPVVFIIYCVFRGASAIAGDEEDGTLEMILSNPISRFEFVLHKFVANFISAMILGFVFWGAIYTGVLIVDMDISSLRIWEATLSGVLLGMVFGNFALALGCVFGGRNMSAGVSGGLAIFAYLANVLLPLVESMEFARRASPFYYYISADPLSNGFNFLHGGMLISMVILLLLLSLVGFGRRDIST